MGCDIHLYIESKEKEGWVPVVGGYQYAYLWCSEKPDREDNLRWFYSGRNYILFSLLADVRNDGDIIPISQPRGIPDDISSEMEAIIDLYRSDGHSHSYYTLDELLAYNWDQGYEDHGTVTEEEYIQFKKDGKPSSWCGSVSGGFVEVVSNEKMDAIISGKIKREKNKNYFTKISWGDSTKSSCSFFHEALLFLKEISFDEGRDIRLVFFFDN